MPISYFSHRLSPTETKFSTYELECLAAILSMENFRPYLEHSEFLLETDNMALSWLLSHPKQQGRIARWVMRVSSFRFKATHIRGTQNVLADCLSRMYEETHIEKKSCNTVSEGLAAFPMAFTDLKEHQQTDQVLKNIIERLQKKEIINGYSLRSNLLHFKAPNSKAHRIVLPSALFPMVFKFHHESPLGALRRI